MLFILLNDDFWNQLQEKAWYLQDCSVDCSWNHVTLLLCISICKFVYFTCNLYTKILRQLLSCCHMDNVWLTYASQGICIVVAVGKDMVWEAWWKLVSASPPIFSCCQRRKPCCRHNPRKTGFILPGFCLCYVSVIRELNSFFTCFRKLTCCLGITEDSKLNGIFSL